MCLPYRKQLKSRCIKGLTSEKAKDYVNAIKAYTKALEINPRYAKVYQHRGTAWTKQNDKEKRINKSSGSIPSGLR